jgi:serine/threonine-protein kinase
MVELAGPEEATMHDGEIVFDDELLLDPQHALDPDPVVTSERFAPEERFARQPPRSERARRENTPRVGEMFAAKYRIERVYRASALGVTLDAMHVQLGQRVAIKLLSADPEAHPEAVARFLRGARTAVQMQNEHIARVIDVGTLVSGVPYVVSEHLSGSDLRHVLRVREAVPVPEAIEYALQACEALADGHGLGLVHRNLKPSNLFLTRRDGAPLLKVLDFFTSEDPLSDVASNQASMSASLRSLAYLAPEQIRQPAAVDVRADIWALGAILHEMLSGVALYEAESTPALLAAIAADPATPLTQLRPEIPLELEATVLRCLAKERGERFPTVLELATELRRFAPAESQQSLERIAKGLARRGRTTRPPPLPGDASRAIVHVPAPPKKEPKVAEAPAPPSRRLGELVLTGLGFGCAAAIGALAAIHSMQGALPAQSPRAVVAELSPALPAQPPATAAAPSSASPSGAAPVLATSPAARAPAPAPAQQGVRPSPKVEFASAARKAAVKAEPHVVASDAIEPKPVVAKNSAPKDLFDDAN